MIEQLDKYDQLNWEIMKQEARYNFEANMIYMEKNRPEEEQFYKPRQMTLKRVADVIQKLWLDELDEIFIWMPSRVGKTQIAKNGFNFFGGTRPESTNLYTAYSDKITTPFHTGLSELITDPTYTYHEIFCKNKIVRSNGKDTIIDLNRAKTYPTFTCRSIYGTLNGACDCNGLAIADDLLSGIEEAKNPERLDTVWGKYDNNFMKRLKGKAKLINMGTRWALKDPQGRRLDLLENREEYAGRRYEVVSIPALNDLDESNFDYPYHLGYSTNDYKMIRASFEENDDIASWYAQDQQQPIERLGSLFEDGGMQFFKPEDMPQDKEPDRIFMSCDEAFGGGDFVSAPVLYQFGEDYYVVDTVFNNGEKDITQPRIVETILNWKVQAIQFEETKTTMSYRTDIEKELKEKHHYKLNSYGKATPGKLGKISRILDKAPEIRKMHFLEEKYRSKEYKKFILNLYEFNKEGKAKHDDAPDSLAMLCDMKYNIGGKVSATKNPFMR